MKGDNIMPFEVINDKYGVVFSENTADLFEEESSVEPYNVVRGKRGCVPWGEDNLKPVSILEKIRKNEVMNSNMQFNIQTGYGDGFEMKHRDGSEVDDEEILDWIDDNNINLFYLEQWTDLKHFYFSVAEIILNGEGSKIVELNHLENYYIRFEEANPKTGKLEHVFYANWENDPSQNDITTIPLLDQRNPLKDLKRRVNEEKTRDRKFAILMKVPIPGKKYYPYPYYFASFRSGWYDVSAMTATAKKMAMQYGIKVRFMVRIHPEYWKKLFEEENITDPDAQIKRKKEEYVNIKNFLTSYENEGKTWFNGYYINPDGKEVPYVQIEKVDYDKGGDFNQDAEEASNMICYAQGVHPSLIGATPGKSKGSFSGTDKRELFTMKQSMERPFKDLLLTPMKVVKGFNDWPKDIKFDLPMILLTTLDQGTDAQKVNRQNQELKNQVENANNNN